MTLLPVADLASIVRYAIDIGLDPMDTDDAAAARSSASSGPNPSPLAAFASPT